MADATKTRLFKIASEINIGKETIVDFLKSKGYSIENKPTATLDEDMVKAVHDKFKKELRAVEVQREKLQKHRVVKPTVEAAVPDEMDDFLPEKEEPKAKQEEVKPKEEPIQPKAVPEEQIKKVETPKVPAETEVKEKPSDLKIEAEVKDIKPTEKKTAEETKVVEQKVEQAQKPIVQEPVAESKPTEKLEVKKQESEKQKPEAEKPKQVAEKPKQEAVKATEAPQAPKKPERGVLILKKDQVKPADKSQDKGRTDQRRPKDQSQRQDRQTDRSQVSQQGAPKKDARPQTDGDKRQRPTEQRFQKGPAKPDQKFQKGPQKPQTQQFQQEQQAQQGETEQQAARRKKKKRKNIIEVQPGQMPQLRGLTVLGKLDMTKPKPADSQQGRGRPTGEGRPGFAPKTSDTEFGRKTGIKGLIKAKPTKDFTVDADAENKGPKTLIDKKRKKRKKSIRDTISEKDVDRAIRQTISGMDDAHSGALRAKLRQKKKTEREEKETKAAEEKLRESRLLSLTEFVTTADLANMMGIPINEIILKCMQLGLMVTINQRLDKEAISVIADDYDFQVEFYDDKQLQFIDEDDEDDIDQLPRPPIVTIMGHVDHGKTSLLDHIRKSNVVSGEAGGITQHIGAYKVPMPNNKSITFLDTPGHEAFTAMRARGAQVTDIVVLVVAADDSVMPQTVEAISHALAANVPIVVAINKIDKPDSNPDRIRQQLADYKILVEEWGGKYQAVEISAKFGKNIDQLLEKILLEAEFLELKANPYRKPRGLVIESNMNKGFGPVATVIVQKGTLSVGDPFVTGVFSGRVRAMQDEHGAKVEVAKPSDPVLVIGCDGMPEAGDSFIVPASEQEARNIANERKQLKREQEIRKTKKISLDEFSSRIQAGTVRELNLVLKGDVTGSIEALSDSLLKLSTEEVRVNILHKGVGSITETDIMLAVASDAVVIGFNVNPTGSARKAAEAESVDVRLYNIIYDCINEIQLALEGLLAPELKEETLATVEIRKVFRISRIGSVAGCYVLSGKISRNDKIRVMRNGLEIFKGSIESLKRGKDDVKEVDAKYECGIQLHGFNDVQDGDIIESFKIVEVKRYLK